ncbi:MAG: hypothetical protein ACR2GG_05545 [Gemmatimonadaceae bacterium]
MDFGAQPVFDGHSAPVPDGTLKLAWFERSSVERSATPERGLADVGGGLLDRVREDAGLVYNGDGEYES